MGYQLEPSEISAAFALVQLENLNNNIKKRINFFQKHNNFFKKYNDLFILPQETKDVYTGWLAYPLIVKETAKFSRTDLQIFLEKRNIQTRVVFTGNILRQPGFKNIKKIGNAEDFTNADNVMRGGILLGCHHGLDDELMNHIHSSIDLFMSEKN